MLQGVQQKPKPLMYLYLISTNPLTAELLHSKGWRHLLLCTQSRFDAGLCAVDRTTDNVICPAGHFLVDRTSVSKRYLTDVKKYLLIEITTNGRIIGDSGKSKD